MSITLFTRSRNSAGERVRIALNLKGVDYEYVVAGPLNSAAYLKLNPQGLMPTLQFDGKSITQSLAIIEMLDEKFAHPSLFPSNPILRAKSRAFAQTICSELHSITVHRVRGYLKNTMGANEGTITDWYRHWTAVTLGALEKMLNTREETFSFCYANYPTIADITLVPQLANARRFDCSLEDFPKLLAVDRRCRELPAFCDATAENQPDYRG